MAEPTQEEVDKTEDVAANLKQEPPSLAKLDSDKLSQLSDSDLPDPKLLSPKSAMIVRLKKKVMEKDNEIDALQGQLKKTKKKNNTLLVKSRSESFQIENLKKQVSEAKETADKAVDKTNSALAQLGNQKREFQEKYNTLYKAQEAEFKAQQATGNFYAARQQKQDAISA